MLVAVLVAVQAASPGVSAAPPEGPTVAVLLSRRVQVSAAESARLTAQVSGVLAELDVPVVEPKEVTRRLGQVLLKDATTCGGKPACLKEVGRSVGVDHLVLVSVSLVDGERGLGLQLLRVEDASVIHAESTLLEAKQPVQREQLAGFAAAVVAALRPPAPPQPAPPVEDAPKDPPPVTIQPVEPPPAPPPLVQTAPPPRSRVVPIVLLVTSLAALGTAAYFGISAGLAAPRLSPPAGDDGVRRAALTERQAQALAQSLTVSIIVASLAGAAGVGLGTAAILTW